MKDRTHNQYGVNSESVSHFKRTSFTPIDFCMYKRDVFSRKRNKLRENLSVTAINVKLNLDVKKHCVASYNDLPHSSLI